MIAEHASDPFPESIQKGATYGEVDAAYIDADLVMYEIAGEICGWQPIVAKPGCQLERQAAYRGLQRLTDWEGGAPR